MVSARIVADGEGSLSDGRDLERALMKVLPKLRGAFSFVLMDDAHLIGVRDPNGFRPLCLGRLDRGWVVASEPLERIPNWKPMRHGQILIADGTQGRFRWF